MSRVCCYIMILLLLMMNRALFAQNLVSNQSFEDANICTEYNSPCAVEGWFYIKPCEVYQLNVSPGGLTGRYSMPVPVKNVYAPHRTPQWVYTMLLCPMVKGKTYRITFFLNSFNLPYFPIEVAFSRREPVTFGFEKQHLDTLIAIGSSRMHGEMARGWKIVQFDYVAKGRERFFSIGNLTVRPMQFPNSAAMNQQGIVYYFIDDIMIKPGDGIIPCNDVQETVTKIYNQNMRHTDKVIRLLDTTTLKREIRDTINIPSVYFETNKANIRPEFQKKINGLLTGLKGKTINALTIVGHTDSVGTDESNLILATERAVAVKNFMVKTMPALRKIISIQSKGRSAPIAPNDTEEGRSLNRRVEIILSGHEDL